MGNVFKAIASVFGGNKKKKKELDYVVDRRSDKQKKANLPTAGIGGSILTGPNEEKATTGKTLLGG